MLSLEQGFDWNQNSFYCNKFYLIDKQNPERNDSHWWRVFILEKLPSMCTGNKDDNERSEVFNWLIKCIYSVQIEARDHGKRRTRFFN